MSPLHIYRASAGSGKTFALTLEYLKLMFRMPGVHRNILAVTFTNRAAGEMKQRILRRLHALSRYTGSDPPEEMEELKSVSGLDEQGVKKRAGELLNLILNDYSWFSVGTIDKFFQSVIRAFTREIGVQPGYNLELDHNRILVLAIERLFQELGGQEDLQQWLIRFAEERMEESMSWNFRNDVIELGMQLFRESFQGLFLQHDLSVIEKENLRLFIQDLVREEELVTRRMTAMGRQAMDRMERSGVEAEDFRGKGRSPAMLFLHASREENVNFTDAKVAAIDQIDKWLNKGADKEMLRLTSEELMPLYEELYGQQVMLNSIAAVRKNIYTLGILGDIWEQIKSYTAERNLFLIADSSRFLKGIIGGNQVPFIYERTGNRYSHIMLDEFQDTSVFQYDNFKPLLDHALAGGYFNLAVGDVKQSIYRWRNSDWNILASELEEDFSHQEIRVHHLDRNYRSRELIIRFNNTVFQLAPALLSRVIEGELSGSTAERSEARRQVERFNHAYADAVQQIPENRKGTDGAIRMEIFREQEEGFRESVLKRIPEWIGEIMSAGIEPGEIAILVRNRKEGSLVANSLLEHSRRTGEGGHLRLVSSESLLLENNLAVALILSSLRYLVFPDDPLNNALFKYQFSRLTGDVGHLRERWFDKTVSPAELLGPEVAERMQNMRNLPLYELLESLIQLLDLHEREVDLPYLQALLDVVIDLQRREPLGISDFLHYWDQHGAKQGIHSSEDSNAIRILTIHKAKGLEFKAVIVPYCSWEITTDHRKSNILWCDTRGTPFERIPVLPVRFGRQMQQTLFSAGYYQERMKGYMDNLNLLYVAFTRARDALYLGIPDRGEEKLTHVGDLICSILTQAPVKGPALNPLETYRQENRISIGELPETGKATATTDHWQFTRYPVTDRKNHLRIRLRNDDYFVDEEGRFRTSRMYGNVMHMIFSRIETIADVEKVLGSLHRDGLLPGSERDRVREQIHAMIRRAGVEEWFSGGSWTVHNERSILCGGGRVIRPDRVMTRGDRARVVDFKFGEVERAAYLEQVAGYMRQLSGLGYREVEGYVWYVNLGRTVQISET